MLSSSIFLVSTVSSVLVAVTSAGSKEVSEAKEVGRYLHGELRTVLTLVLVGVGVLIVLSILYWLYKKFGGGRFAGTTQCYLCLERVPTNEWSSGEHRRQCSSANPKLDKMPCHPNKKCPLCHQQLRQWPQSGVHLLDQFKCYSTRCDQGDAINNTGDNRFTCFPCNVSFCDKCVAGGDANKVTAPMASAQV